MSNTEIWADVNDYEGLYQVSNFGNVYSLPRQVRQGKYGRTRVVGGELLTATDNGNGSFVCLPSPCKQTKEPLCT